MHILHPRDGSLWDKLIIIVSNYSHSSLLRYYLYRADPLTIWDRVDYARMQELQDLFLHYFSHRIISPSLRLPRRCSIGFHGYAMSVDSGAERS